MRPGGVRKPCFLPFPGAAGHSSPAVLSGWRREQTSPYLFQCAAGVRVSQEVLGPGN